MKINELQRDFLLIMHYRTKMLKIKSDESVGLREQNPRCRAKCRNSAGKSVGRKEQHQRRRVKPRKFGGKLFMK